MYIHKITVERPNSNMRRFLKKFRVPHQDDLLRDTFAVKNRNIVITTPSPFLVAIIREKGAQYDVTVIVDVYENECTVQAKEEQLYSYLYE